MNNDGEITTDYTLYDLNKFIACSFVDTIITPATEYVGSCIEHYTRKNFADYCVGLPFTYDEIYTLKHAIDNSLKYSKECINNPSYSKESISSIKKSSVSLRNLQAKFAKFFKSLDLI